ncbi:ABC transporter substrate-binding protein [Paenibacillus pectinilyticus]|uniref:ABC transporter substrate-binding protein n=1 Tax=Paenibacillus pectinilyticus TaxID=512399 RepID=A0A1C0ZTS4_9BACL|nr:extracellular solute-binding protein [Paenibacillus pectinilyticus]OCT11478.1 ABC transporter substrate-binding protein [Paenibacillus pectinilyticus]
MKKRNALILSSALVTMSVLSACGSTTEKGATGSATPATSTAPAATQANAKPVTLKYYTWDNESNQAKTQKIIDGFHAKYPNVTVQNVALVPGNSVDSMKKMDVLMSSGEEVDVLQYSNIDETLARAATGVLAPLDEFYAKSNVKPEEDYFINPKVNGKYYATMMSSSPYFVLINQDALKEANLPLPSFDWTWDDFRDYAKKLSKGEGNDKRYGAYFHSWGEYTNLIAYSELKSPYLTSDLKPAFNDPSFTYFFNLRRAMEKDDKSVKALADVVGAKLSYVTEYLNGKAAMLATAPFMLDNVMNKEKYPHTFKSVIAPLPRSSKSGEQGVTNIAGSYMSIASNSKHKQEAYDFIRYLTTEQEARLDFSGYKKADPKLIVDRLYGKAADLIDVPSLTSTIFDKRVKTNFDPAISAPYGNQLKAVLEKGFSKFILDNTSAEEAQKWMMDEADKIAKQNTK